MTQPPDLAARIGRRLEQAAMAVAIAALLVVTASMIAQVVFRYGLGAPLQWSEIMSVYALVWVVFFGAGALAFRDGHVSIASLTDLLPPPGRAAMAILARLAVVAFAAMILWIAWGWIATGRHQISPSLGISTRWVKLALPIGAGLMGIAALLRLWTDLRAALRGDWGHFPRLSHPDG